MTTETVLTDAQIFDCFDCQCAEMVFGFDADELYAVGRAIEQAVLQSPEVQAWKKDAGRYRFLRGQNLDDGTDTAPWISAASTDDERWGLNGEIADSRIDAAMEAKE